MKLSKAYLFAPLLGLLLSMPVSAHQNDYKRFNHYFDRQSERIDNGIHSGQLTRKEAKILRREHRHIAKLKKKYLRDGDLSRKERRALRRKMEKSSNRIYQLKHNDTYRKHKARHYGRDNYYGGHVKKHTWYSHHDRHVHRWYDDNSWSLILGLWDH